MSRQWQDAGGAFINEEASGEWQDGGGSFINNSAVPPVVQGSQVPGGAFVNHTNENEQQIPGHQFLNEGFDQGFVFDYLNAASDITDGTWVTETGGTDLTGSVDEGSPNDSDYIGTRFINDTCEIKLEGGFEPSDKEHFYVCIQIPQNFPPVGQLEIKLMDGASTIQTWTETNPQPGLKEYKVTETIPAYTDLRIRLKTLT